MYDPRDSPRVLKNFQNQKFPPSIVIHRERESCGRPREIYEGLRSPSPELAHPSVVSRGALPGPNKCDLEFAFAGHGLLGGFKGEKKRKKNMNRKGQHPSRLRISS